MNTRLTIGISEDREFKRPGVPRANFDPTGPYRSAIMLVDRLLSSSSSRRIYDDYWARCIAGGSTLPAATKTQVIEQFKDDLRWILILEADTARIWLEGPIDYRSKFRSRQSTIIAEGERIKKIIKKLRHVDNQHAYLLRLSFDHAMQDFLSDEKIRRRKRLDPNTKSGFTWQTVSGPIVRDREFQFISRLANFRFAELLDAWEREIDLKFKPWQANWREFGALRFENPVSPRAAAKMNVGQLGLIARLTSRLRDFTASRGVSSYGTGQPIPEDGRPCWDIVAEFVNCALTPDVPLTGDTVQRIWRKFSSKHAVRIQQWPKPARTEPQVQKI